MPKEVTASQLGQIRALKSKTTDPRTYCSFYRMMKSLLEENLASSEMCWAWVSMRTPEPSLGRDVLWTHYSPDPRVLLCCFFNFWLYWVLVAVRWLSPLALRGVYLPVASLVRSHCGGFLQSIGSRAHGLSCPMACGIS